MMKNHNKFSAKLLSFALAIAMVAAVLPGTAFAAEINGMSEYQPEHTSEAPAVPDNVKSIPKRTLGLDLVSHTDAPLDKDGNLAAGVDGIFDMVADEGWKWDKNTMILTLNGLDIDVTGSQYALNVPAGVTIVSEGTNSLVSDTTNTLRAFGDLEIGGTGSLTIVSNKFSGITVADNCDLTITSGTLSVNTLGGGSASATDDDGIYSGGTIQINGGSVHAKGDEGYVAIRAKKVQTSGEAATSKITLTDLLEKNGGKVAFSDWNSFKGDTTSWTSFIGKEPTALEVDADGEISNGLLEVWVAAPYIVTFDTNGTASTAKVYPNNTVTAPADPTKDGSHFIGWYLNGVKFDFQNTLITEDITMNAQFDVHTPNSDGSDYTTEVTCTVCGETITEAKSHVLSDWQGDATNHWKKCTNGACTHIEKKAAHTWSAEWIIEKPATETEAGSKHRDCSVCRYSETVTIPVVPHTHMASSEWSKDVDTHWNNCTANDGERMNVAVHTWNAGEVTTPATVMHDGVKTYTCTVCGQTKTEGIPKLPSHSALMDNSTGVKVEYEDGSPFNLSIVLNVTSKPQVEMDKFKDNIDKAAPGFVLGGLYDICLLKDGMAIQPDGKVKVSIPLADKMKSMTNLQVVYIDENGNVIIIPSEVKDSMITFVTDHFSNYGVIGKVKATSPGDKNGGGDMNGGGNNNSNNGNASSPQTGDSSPVLLFILMILASGTALVILMQKRRMFKHQKIT